VCVEVCLGKCVSRSLCMEVCEWKFVFGSVFVGV
jgi:hypothetical protein